MIHEPDGWRDGEEIPPNLCGACQEGTHKSCEGMCECACPYAEELRFPADEEAICNACSAGRHTACHGHWCQCPVDHEVRPE